MRFTSTTTMRNWYGLDIIAGEIFEVPAHLIDKARATACLTAVRGRRKKSDGEDID